MTTNEQVDQEVAAADPETSYSEVTFTIRVGHLIEAKTDTVLNGESVERTHVELDAEASEAVIMFIYGLLGTAKVRPIV